MQGGFTKRIVLFILLFGTPLVFLYVLAQGDPNVQGLKYYGKEVTETGKQKINDFLFYDLDSNIVAKESLKDKSLIITTLISSCPSACPIISSQLNNFVYKKIANEKRLNDFVIISQLIDTSGGEADIDAFLKEQPVNSEYWKVVRGNENPIYDFQMPKANLMDNNPKDRTKGGKTYYKMILLIDRNHFVRGIYQGDKSMEIERLNQEIRVLEREYKALEKKTKNK